MIQSNYGYGEDGDAKFGVPANATLIYDIKLVDFDQVGTYLMFLYVMCAALVGWVQVKLTTAAYLIRTGQCD